MAGKVKTSRNKNLRNKFRFVVLNDETFEEKFSLSLSRTNVWVFLGVITFTLIFLTAAAIIYTPLKYFIPGFGDYNYRSEILQLKFKTDSLQDALQARAAWLDNVVNVASGNVDTSTNVQQGSKIKVDKSKIDLNEVKPEVQELRKEVEDADNYSLSYNANNSGLMEDIKEMHLMTPVDGYVTDEYNVQKEHYGIDIAAKEGAPVKAVLDGKVISAAYTLETGYVMEIQHKDNLVSIYKHNASLLKKTGNFVKAGEAIAIVGNTGEFSSGPHLHFELWYEGKSLNPQDYIVF